MTTQIGLIPIFLKVPRFGWPLRKRSTRLDFINILGKYVFMGSVNQETFLTWAMRAGLPGMCLSSLSKYLLYFSQVLGSGLG